MRNRWPDDFVWRLDEASEPWIADFWTRFVTIYLIKMANFCDFGE